MRAVAACITCSGVCGRSAAALLLAGGAGFMGLNSLLMARSVRTASRGGQAGRDDPLPTAWVIVAGRPVWPQSLAFGDPCGATGIDPSPAAQQVAMMPSMARDRQR